MADPSALDRRIAALFRELAELHEQRAGMVRVAPPRTRALRPLPPPNADADRELERQLRRRGFA